MRKKEVILLITLAIGLSFGAADVVDMDEVNIENVDESNDSENEDEPICGSEDVQEVSINTLVEENTLTVEGVYCAESGGHAIQEENVDIGQETVNIDLDIEGPGEGEMATTVITPVPYEVTETLDNGTYDVEVSVSVNGEEMSEASEEVTIEASEKGRFERFRSWLSSLFSF